MNLDNSDQFKLGMSLLPEDIFLRVENNFFSVVKTIAGESVVKILKVQSINSARKLLSTPNVFGFLSIESAEIDAIKLESCFKSKSGYYVIKPGVQSSLVFLINLLKAKLKKEQESTINEDNRSYLNIITEEFLDDHPLLKSLIRCYQQMDIIKNNNSINKAHNFLQSFIDNLASNLTRSPNRFRYDESMKKFALCLYILGGKQTYEFLRLNLYGSLPNLTTLSDLIKTSNMALNEAEFRFQSFSQFHSSFGFCSEDTTGVIRKVEYDYSTNSFVGFATPVTDGVPLSKYFQADTFNDLKEIFDMNEQAPLLNVHMFQGIPSDENVTSIPRPFLLSAYGTNNKCTALDILQRWLYIYSNCLKNGVRVIGFSTDADAKYLSAMRLASGFFASSPKFKLETYQHAFKINIPKAWTWFFLEKNQLLLFYQDPVHLVTKWRNRLFSTIADLCFGIDKISIKHIEELIDDDRYTKLDHGITRSDINPKDRQNYRSCVKLISDDVINLLNDRKDTKGTVIYLMLLKMIVRAYIDKSTTLSERLESAWCVVFVCRIWWSWLKKTSSSSFSRRTTTSEQHNHINKYFITKPAYLSVELNAHNMLYMVLLVKQHSVPKQALINIHLFNSQGCESLFRDARSLSGSFSTIVNFTVNNFIKRSQKLAILNQFKYDQTEHNLSFPKHHKHKHDDSTVLPNQMNEIDKLDVEQIISNAYDQAIHISQHSKMLDVLERYDLIGLQNLSEFVFDNLTKTSKMFNYSSQMTSYDVEEFELDDENDDDNVLDNEENDFDDEGLFDFENDDDVDEKDMLTSTKSEFNGIRIVDDIDPNSKQSYFRIKLNDKIKYLHKQSACWLLANKITKLSSDRLSRCKQQSS